MAFEPAGNAEACRSLVSRCTLVTPIAVAEPLLGESWLPVTHTWYAWGVMSYATIKCCFFVSCIIKICFCLMTILDLCGAGFIVSVHVMAGARYIFSLGRSRYSELCSILLHRYWESVLRLKLMGFHEEVARSEAVQKSITPSNFCGDDRYFT